jgi:hypothetical protein
LGPSQFFLLTIGLCFVRVKESVVLSPESIGHATWRLPPVFGGNATTDQESAAFTFSTHLRKSENLLNHQYKDLKICHRIGKDLIFPLTRKLYLGMKVTLSYKLEGPWRRSTRRNWPIP